MKTAPRRHVLKVAGMAGIATSVGVPAIAQSRSAFRPTKTVTIVVPASAGGGTDATSRLAAKELEEMWGQTVIIDNRPGGNTSVGTAMVARATPDGHTLLINVTAIAVMAHLMKLPYDTATSFAPITAIAYPAVTLLATPSLPANDLRELQALVRKEGPEKRTCASPDPGSRLIAERIFDAANIKLLNVPYKGASMFVGDIASGRVDVGIASVASGLALINDGKLKSLGIIGTKRIPALPNTATFREQGFSNLDDNSYYGLFAPAGTPVAIIDAIYKDIVALLSRQEFQNKLVDLGCLPGGDTPYEFNERFQRDIRESGEAIRRLGLSLE